MTRLAPDGGPAGFMREDEGDGRKFDEPQDTPMARSGRAYTAEPWISPWSRPTELRVKKLANAILAQRCPRPIAQAIHSQPTAIPAATTTGAS